MGTVCSVCVCVNAGFIASDWAWFHEPMLGEIVMYRDRLSTRDYDAITHAYNVYIRGMDGRGWGGGVNWRWVANGKQGQCLDTGACPGFGVTIDKRGGGEGLETVL